MLFCFEWHFTARKDAVNRALAYQNRVVMSSHGAQSSCKEKFVRFARFGGKTSIAIGVF